MCVLCCSHAVDGLQSSCICARTETWPLSNFCDYGWGARLTRWPGSRLPVIPLKGQIFFSRVCSTSVSTLSRALTIPPSSLAPTQSRSLSGLTPCCVVNIASLCQVSILILFTIYLHWCFQSSLHFCNILSPYWIICLWHTDFLFLELPRHFHPLPNPENTVEKSTCSYNAGVVRRFASHHLSSCIFGIKPVVMMLKL